MTRSYLLAAAMLCLVWVGCNRQQDTSPTSEAAQTPHFDVDQIQMPVAEADPVARSEPQPDAVVQDFLTAVREGDTYTTSALLTDKAREETARHNLVVEPPGTPTAKFEIGEVQYIDDQKTGAYVNTVWTESDQASTVRYDVVWALRRQSTGWRVAGIATEIVEGQPPVFLNFEDPADMLAKWKQAEEVASQHEQTILQASPTNRETKRR